MVRDRLGQDVNLSKIAEGGFSAVVEPSLETDTVLDCTKSVKHSRTCRNWSL
jgi:hypothetical protein